MHIVHDDGTQNKFVLHVGWQFADCLAAWLDYCRKHPEHDEAAMPVTASEEIYMDADLAQFRRDGLPAYVVTWSGEEADHAV